jgi:hypothetical protein
MCRQYAQAEAYATVIQNIIWYIVHFAEFPVCRIKFLPVGVLIFAEFQEEFGKCRMEFDEFHLEFGKY